MCVYSMAFSIFTELSEESLDCVLAEGALGIEIVCKVSPIAILE